ncbi:hypothetical protein GCM10018782_05940 [Streptomyces griseoaurantiacus]|nr:hypothetical protein GCM10018782_05940 [Streptomyces griseoaurantiacus]
MITSGLRGGKGIPEHVAAHPRVFATFTAPSFGPVHNRPTGPAATIRPCRCGTRHDQDDDRLGTPLDPDRYDYEAAVLWNAHAGALWQSLSTYLRREVAKRAGLSQRRFREHARVSFAKVAEYQKRGAVHFHAVIRLDGPGGGDTPPPSWATAELLTDAIRAAAKGRVDGPDIDGRAHTFTFGRQLDVRTIRSADFDGGRELTERAVAAYIAKYSTKGAETATGALDRPLKFAAELAQLDLSDHARRLIRTAWTLGARKDLEHLRLRAWAPHAWLPRPLLHQVPPLLHHPRRIPRRPRRMAPRTGGHHRHRTRDDVRPRALGLRRNRPLRHRSLARRLPQPAPGTDGEPTRG